MDTHQYMIVDLAERGDKRMFKTEKISFIKENSNGFWSVRFLSSPRLFNYNRARLLYLTNPGIVDIEDKGLYVRNRRVTNLKELLRFSDGYYTFYHVVYANGYYEDLDGRDVYITRTPISRGNGSMWDYLRKLVDETGLLSDDNENLLSKQYDMVDLKRDNVPLAYYLGNKSVLTTRPFPSGIYYPFGCNASQKLAVERALTHQVSIIQGPPGTGKTQTILNIIANLLMDGKTVLVVSNNNSAVDNVEEKLSGVGLGFIIAKLGSKQNKELFIANQSKYPKMDDWILKDVAIDKGRVICSLDVLSKYFESQLRRAVLKAEYDTLRKEQRYNELFQQNIFNRKWLEKRTSSKLMRLLHLYRMIIERGHKPSILFRLRWSILLGYKFFSFLKEESHQVIASLESAYYHIRKTELEQEMDNLAKHIQSVNMEERMKELCSSSLRLLRDQLAKKYGTGVRNIFKLEDLRWRTEDFLKEYPVVLSTTYSSKGCINKDMVFDYVIMDETSQVDIKTGALALSCALNAVIVGDDKQLPNVVSHEETLVLNAIRDTFHVDEKYNAVTHSFLQSCIDVFREIPVTLLREHYRCHPKIIEFCNQKFYNGELIPMTVDKGEDDVLQVICTAEGNHARGHFNRREIDVIVKEIMPIYSDMKNIGIITPYRLQANEINKALGCNRASTVHKYQGRECDTIIMSMVDNMPTDFSDNANLLNVAISRAKQHLCIVTNGNDMPENSNLAQLIAYIRYNNFEVKGSKLHSVFDLLYKQCTEERLAYESAHSSISDFLSENLIYDTLIKAIDKLKCHNLDVLCHYPLSRLIADWTYLDEGERRFAESPLAHVDFLIYNSLTKRPLQVIEVDGWMYHNENRAQQARDKLKDRILSKFELCPNRLSTTDIVDVDVIKGIISHD